MATPHSPQTIEAEGSSLEDAKDVVRSQLPEGLAILSVEVVSREGGRMIFGTAATIEEAYAKAQEDVPDGMEVVGKEIQTSPDRAVVTVEAFDEQGAEQSALAQVKERLRRGPLAVDAIELVGAGTKKLLGIRKASPNRYEVQVVQQATVVVPCFKKAKIRATIGIPPELARQEMEVLHNLLAIFSTYGGQRRGSDSGLQREYVEWWCENQYEAPEIAEKLGLLSESGSRVLDREQARQMKWLLSPVVDLLKSLAPLGKDEIAARMGFGYVVTRWCIGEMDVLGRGHLTGKVLFDECYQALGAALGR